MEPNVPATVPSELECRLCGHRWEPRIPNPLCCPACKRYDWERARPRKTPEPAPAEGVS